MNALAKTESEQAQTMSSREILELLNSNREKPMQLKHLHRDIRELFGDEEGEIFGLAVKVVRRPNGQVESYNLPEVESKMLVATKDKSYLRKITEYWVNREKDKPAPAKKELSAGEVMEVLSGIAGILRLPESGKVQMLQRAFDDQPQILKALPHYGVDAPVIDGYVEAVTEGSAKPTHALSYHLKNNDRDYSAVKANKALIELGILQTVVRSNGKTFKSITETGLKYGKNLVSSKSTSTTQPHFYTETIGELLGLIDGVIGGVK